MGTHKTKKAASPYADGRGSKVNPDLDAAMRGKGGDPVQKRKKRPAAKKRPTRAELMDAGRPLPQLKKDLKKAETSEEMIEKAIKARKKKGLVNRQAGKYK